MRLLEKVEHKVIREVGKAKRGEGLEKNIGRNKIKRVIKKLKDEKVARIDEIPSETWTYEGKRLKK